MVEPPGIPISEEGPDVPWGARVVTWPGYQGGAHRCCGVGTWPNEHEKNFSKMFQSGLPPFWSQHSPVVCRMLWRVTFWYMTDTES